MDTEILRDRMKLLIDRVMSEAGLYAPDYAALALKQCEGSTEEAVFLLRAYRSTLSRNYTSRTCLLYTSYKDTCYGADAGNRGKGRFFSGRAAGL